MLIECENCNKKFEIEESLIPKDGRLLQCGSCNHKWFFSIDKIKEKVNEDKVTIENKSNLDIKTKGTDKITKDNIDIEAEDTEIGDTPPASDDNKFQDFKFICSEQLAIFICDILNRGSKEICGAKAMEQSMSGSNSVGMTFKSVRRFTGSFLISAGFIVRSDARTISMSELTNLISNISWWSK